MLLSCLSMAINIKIQVTQGLIFVIGHVGFNTKK